MVDISMSDHLRSLVAESVSSQMYRWLDAYCQTLMQGQSWIGGTESCWTEFIKRVK